MIVVKVELHSAITGEVSDLGSMVIANDATGTPSRGNYFGKTFRKGAGEWWKHLRWPKPVREGRVEDYPRKALPVWSLVKRMLDDMGF